ncbi:MAG: amidohydrolase, partial [Phycicoccus sp.]
MTLAAASAAIASRIGPDLVALRRRLHRIPERGLHLPDTQSAVLDALAGLPLEVTTGESLSSVVAVVRGAAPHDGERPAVLLRGDMDALPVTEEVDVEYASERTGLMHA